MVRFSSYKSLATKCLIKMQIDVLFTLTQLWGSSALISPLALQVTYMPPPMKSGWAEQNASINLDAYFLIRGIRGNMPRYSASFSSSSLHLCLGRSLLRLVRICTFHIFFRLYRMTLSVLSLQVNEVLMGLRVRSKGLERILESYLAIRPRHAWFVLDPWLLSPGSSIAKYIASHTSC